MRLRRWAVVARTWNGQYEVRSWHLTYRGAHRRREYVQLTHADRGNLLLIMPHDQVASLTS